MLRQALSYSRKGMSAMARKGRMLWELFCSTMKISACTFGGGFVIVPLMRKRFVEQLHWIDEREMLDLISVCQAAPGPIAVNASLTVGYRVGGFAGAAVAVFGTVLPPLVIISAISFFYRQFRDNAYVSAVMRGMQAGIAAVICSVAVDLGRSALKTNRALSALTMAGAFAAVYFFRVNILWVILACALIGLVAGRLSARRAKAADAEGRDRP